MQQGTMPIEYLIAAPLEAIVRAQAMSARTTAEFVGEVGFETDKEGVSRVRMIDFEYSHPRADADNPGNMIDTQVKVRVPVLSLLSIPSVTIDEASVELQLRVTGHQPVQPIRPTTAAPANTRLAEGIGTRLLPLQENRMRMVGAVTAPKLADQTSSLKISIKLKQSPTPEGLAQILSLLGESTTARPVTGK